MSNFFTNIKDKLFPKPDLDFDEDYGDDSEEIGDIEVESEDPQSVSEAKKKNLIITAAALLLSVIIYFVIFSEEEVKEQLVETSKFEGRVERSSESPFEIDIDQVKEDKDVTILDAPEVPELPDFPEADEVASDDLSLEDSLFEEDIEEEVLEEDGDGSEEKNPAKDKEEKKDSVDQEESDDGEIESLVNASDKKRSDLSDPRYAPIIVVKGSPGNDISGVGTDNNLKILNDNKVVDVADSEDSITPTRIKNRENVVAQGKIITAVLETAIDTEIEGSARAIVSRDVYGEVGNKVLMPKGSRLYGSYQALTDSNSRGLARVEITWDRLIRPDGISIAVNSSASDQFGRAGIEGNVDNKVQETIANSFLSSVLAIAGIAATDALTGGSTATTTTNPNTGTNTITQTAINQAVSEVATDITKSAKNAVSGFFNTRPRITIPQGTRVNIIVNADIKVPTFEK